METDIRWVLRFDNYEKAFSQLKNAVDRAAERALSDLEKQGLIQSFEFTHELSWKVLKDFLEDRGNAEIYGAKDAVREAFQYGLLEDNEVWMDMIRSRNLSSHSYNEKTAVGIINSVCEFYFPAFNALRLKFAGLIKQEDELRS